MAVSLAAVPRAAPEKKVDDTAAVAPAEEAQPEPPAPQETPQEAQPADVLPHETAYTPEIEPQTSAGEAAQSAEALSSEPTTEYVPQSLPDYVPEAPAARPAQEDSADAITGSFPEYVPPSLPDYVPQEMAPPAAEEVSAEGAIGSFSQYVPPVLPDYVSEPASAPSIEAVNVASEPEAAPPEIAPPAPAAAPAAPSFASTYGAPLGAARRFGVSEPDLPIEVGEEERRLHNDARRFARLLVSEIKLYNEPKVKEGRSRSDIYERLRDDIDRSRQMYDKRVAPPVAARHDYFHQELVNTLAEGDAEKLGASYPGASGVAN
jgi:hypothetical protein